MSSVVDGFGAFRHAAREAILAVGGEAVLVNEDMPSLPTSSRNACLDAIDSCDVHLTVIGERGGWTAPSGKLVVEEEYEHAVARKRPVLVFLQDGPRDAAADRLARRLSEYVAGAFRRTFSTPDDLRREVERALTPLLTAGPSPTPAVRTQSADLFSKPYVAQGHAMLRLALTPERDEEVISPTRLESAAFLHQVYATAHRPDVAFLSYERPKAARIDRTSLVVLQADDGRRQDGVEHVRVEIAESGQLVLDANVTGRQARGRTLGGLASMVVAAEAIEATLATCFRFAGALYADLDPHGRHQRFVYNVALSGLAYRTIERNPQPRSSHTMSMRGDGPVTAFDAARVMTRNDLAQPHGEIERAMTLLLRNASR